MTKTSRNILTVILIVAAAALGIAVALVVIDVHEDRQYQVKITGNTKLYNSPAPSPEKRGTEGVIQVLQPGEEVRVLRITRGEDYDAIRIELKDGRTGYIFLGDNFELSK